jgi:O-antigen biosynthesis protein
MTEAPVSVIVVSRHRAEALRRCLTGISQLDHPNFEVIVVADPAALATLGATDAYKTCVYDEANISAARNLGLDQAAGEVVAFIDDDAVPEPTWLSRLTAPFNDASVGAAGGFVRGRNGISYQWRASEVDAFGQDHPLEVDPDVTTLHAPVQGRAIKTQGTNCAFRLKALADIGGFDEALHFYLDEADVNLRLARAGWTTAVVPRAQVHHGYAASARRSSTRAPLTLFDIGASSAVFLRRHAPTEDPAPILARLEADQHRRLIAMMGAGVVKPRDIARLRATLVSGIVDGTARALPPLTPRLPTSSTFQPMLHTGPCAGLILAGRPWSRRRLRAEAQSQASEAIVTLFRFSPTTLAHHMRYDPAGFWEQIGGLFGRADRAEARVQPWTFSARLRHETRRISDFRPIQ